MRPVYSRQALADLDTIAIYYATHAIAAIADSIGRRLRGAVERICHAPEAAPRVTKRSRVRVTTVVRYPFRIFYRVRGDAIDILHIRHTSRRLWIDVD